MLRCPSQILLMYSSKFISNTHRLSFTVPTHNILSMVSVREANADGLVDEENIRFLVPRVGIDDDIMDIVHPART